MPTLKRLDILDYNTFLDKCEPLAPLQGSDHGEWVGGLGYSKLLTLARRGDETLAGQAEKYLTAFDGLTLPDAYTGKWSSAPTGAYACIPEYVAGHPSCMRQRTRLVSDRAPLHAYVQLGASAKRTAKDIMTRNTAVLALVMIINRYRPVELTVLNDSKCGGDYVAIAVRIPGPPFSLAHASVALGHVGFLRHPMHTYMVRELGVNPAVPLIKDSTEVRKALGVTEHDLFIGKGEDDFTAVLANPAAWVQAQVNKYLEIE